jgi:WD40 repeat protein
VRIFLSFNSKDTALAETIGAGLSRLQPDAKVFFSPISLGSGHWLPKLADGIAEADCFLLLIGPKGIGPWQEVEYFTAFDRHVHEKAFALVPAIVAGSRAPGLSFLRTLNWVEVPILTEDRILHRLLAALKGDALKSATPLWKMVNPYCGLEAMTEANADYFYGRAAETSEVLNTLASKPDRLPILIGASGVGKSSIARAGVLSALKSMRWPGADSASQWPASLQDSRSWISITMRPGSAPLEALAAVFIGLWGLDIKDPEQAGLPRKWAKGLLNGDNKLADLIRTTQDELKKRYGDAPDHVLLYVDQGEELYTQASQSEARRFSEILSEGLSDTRLRALLSLRADYFDRLQADEPLFKLHEHVNVPPLDRSQLQAVVTGPPGALGVTFEDDKIANRIIDAAAAEPGALPLLSYLLTDMWTKMVRRDDPALSLPPHAIDIGGVLSSRAEAFLNDNPLDEKDLRRLLTLRLAMVPSEGEPMRRQTRRAECSDAEWALAARLADHPYRLVVMSERETNGHIVAEVAHEAFLRVWPRLTDWLREERDFLVFKGEVERAERRWRDMGEKATALLTGLDLARAEEWLPKRPDDLSADVVTYTRRSIAADRAAKERQLRFQRRATIGAIVTALLMAVIGGFAGLQWKDALLQRDRASQAETRVLGEKQRADIELTEAQTTQSRFLADLAQQRSADGDAGTAILLALNALPDRQAGITRPYTPEAEYALGMARQKLQELRVFSGHVDSVQSAAFSPDSSQVVTASWDQTARLWNADTGTVLFTLTGHEDRVTSAAFGPDGRRVVTSSWDGTARLWDTSTGHEVLVFRGHEDGVNHAAFSSDGKFVVTASDDRTARLWDVASGEQLLVLRGHEGNVNDATFSPDGKLIATASGDGTARLWDVENGKQILVLGGHDENVQIRREMNSVEFSPDGKLVLTASNDKTARLWDVTSGREITVFRGHAGYVSDATFSPDGKLIATASWETLSTQSAEDNTARIWDAATGEELSVLRGHLDRVYSVAFSSDGTRLVTGGDETARLWAVRNDERHVIVPGRRGEFNQATFSPDGKSLVTASRDRTARVWDASTGKQTLVLRGHQDNVEDATFSPDGRLLATASDDGTAAVWDAANGKELFVLRGHEDAVLRARFSPDGTRLVTASADKTARVWDASTGREILVLRGHEAGVDDAAFSPDSNLVATASVDKTARLWRATTGDQIQVLHGDHPFSAAAFSPDGRQVATASSGGTAQLWDIATGQKLLRLNVGESVVTSVSFARAGKLILTSSWNIVPAEHTVRLWDIASGKQVLVLDGYKQGTVVRNAAISASGEQVIASSDEGVWLWPSFTTTQQLVDASKEAVPRCLTSTQRQQFFLNAQSSDWCFEMAKWPYKPLRFGLSADAVTDDVAKRLGLKETKGMMVSHVMPGLPAVAAGIQPGDVILTINGKPLNDDDAWTSALEGAPTGKQSLLSVYRKGQTLQIPVTPRH